MNDYSTRATKLTLTSDPNGSQTISTDRTTITIRADGTVTISTLDPLQLCGASLAKLDMMGPHTADETKVFTDALLRRLDPRSIG